VKRDNPRTTPYDLAPPGGYDLKSMATVRHVFAQTAYDASIRVPPSAQQRTLLKPLLIQAINLQPPMGVGPGWLVRAVAAEMWSEHDPDSFLCHLVAILTSTNGIGTSDLVCLGAFSDLVVAMVDALEEKQKLIAPREAWSHANGCMDPQCTGFCVLRGSSSPGPKFP
jgi:hypothetical protein